jgi:ferredoxin-nitrate reductase
LVAKGTELEGLRRKLLRLGSGGGGPKGRLICSCNQVGEDDIRACVRSGTAKLDGVCATTRAGTACGSCRGDVRRIVESMATAEVASA